MLLGGVEALSCGNLSLEEDVKYMENEELENEWASFEKLIKIRKRILENQQHEDKFEE